LQRHLTWILATTAALALSGAAHAATATTAITQLTTGVACAPCQATSQALADAVNGAAGVTSLDQAVAGAATQSSVAHIDMPAPGAPSGDATTPGTASASASASQVTEGASVQAASASASIEGSGNKDGPVLMLNQAAGVGASQLNALALAYSTGSGGFAMADAELSQVSRNNAVYYAAATGPVVTTASISNSLNGNTGIVAVNQASGANANQANVISVAQVGGANAFHF
jgi:hypothetical protein